MSLTLVTTPIAETGSISNELKDLLLQAFNEGKTILIEDEKPARRRWRAWDLPREAIEKFVAYNEHSRDSIEEELLVRLKKGEEMYLMSDGGTPGFCDPGRSLIEKCHQKNIQVSVTSCDNSLIPAIALSGFTEGAFTFHAFPPREKEERQKFFKNLFDSKGCQAFMDTPYRLERVLKEVCEATPSHQKGRRHCVVMDINRETQEILWGDQNTLNKNNSLGKKEFLWIIDQIR